MKFFQLSRKNLQPIPQITNFHILLTLLIHTISLHDHTNLTYFPHNRKKFTHLLTYSH